MILEPGTELSFEVIEALSKQNRCRVTKVEPLGNGNTRLTLVAEPLDRPEFVRDTISVTVKGSDGQTYQEKFPVVFDHFQKISALPSRGLAFPARDTKLLLRADAEPLRRDLHVWAPLPETQFQITRLEWLDLPEGVFDAELDPIKPGKRYRIAVFLREHQETPLLRGRLLVHTDHPELPVLEIPIHAQFERASKR